MFEKPKLVAGLNELPSIGKAIGKLEMAMNRCKVDSAKYLDYEKKRDDLVTRSMDITSDIRHYILLSDECNVPSTDIASRVQAVLSQF